MATQYFQCGNNNATIISEIKAALNAKNLITQVLKEDGSNLLFTTPLTTKLIRITTYNGGWDTAMMIYVGTSQVGTSFDMTDQQNIIDAQGGGANGVGIDIFADSDFVCFIHKTTAGATGCGVCYIGALDTGEVVAFGAANKWNVRNNCWALETMEKLTPIFINPCGMGVRTPEDGFYTFPLMFVGATGILRMNNSVPAEAIKIKLTTSIYGGVADVYFGNNYYLTPSTLYLNFQNQNTSTSFLIPYTAS